MLDTINLSAAGTPAWQTTLAVGDIVSFRFPVAEDGADIAGIAVVSEHVVEFGIAPTVLPGWPSRASVTVEFADFNHEPMETPMTGTNLP